MPVTSPSAVPDVTRRKESFRLEACPRPQGKVSRQKNRGAERSFLRPGGVAERFSTCLARKRP